MNPCRSSLDVFSLHVLSAQGTQSPATPRLDVGPASPPGFPFHVHLVRAAQRRSLAHGSPSSAERAHSSEPMACPCWLVPAFLSKDLKGRLCMGGALGRAGGGRASVVARAKEDAHGIPRF